MTLPFVSDLRTSRGAIPLGDATPAETIEIRAQVLEAWDAVRIRAASSASVSSLKLLALEELYPGIGEPNEYVVKLGGFEVLDEDVTLREAGAVNGTIFLIADRRRRPVQ